MVVLPYLTICTPVPLQCSAVPRHIVVSAAGDLSRQAGTTCCGGILSSRRVGESGMMEVAINDWIPTACSVVGEGGKVTDVIRWSHRIKARRTVIDSKT